MSTNEDRFFFFKTNIYTSPYIYKFVELVKSYFLKQSKK